MKRVIDPDELAARLTAELDERLAEADAALASRYPGERAGRQPVHTAYVPADQYAADTGRRWGEEALALLDEHADKFALVVADADIIRRVKAKLDDEPVEDLRIDFEDGYVGPAEGGRSLDDDAEDDHVRQAAHALAESQQDETAPPFTGIRIKSFEKPTRARGVRTLTRFVAALAESRGSLDTFVVTLPKVTSTEQVAAFVHAASTLEDELGLADKAIRFEIQVETPQSVLGPDGTALVARMVHAAGGRLTALHYGTYDYSAFCGIAAEQQSLEHPVADHAKLVMQAAAAGTGVRLSDGSTNVLPVGDADDVHAGLAQPPPVGDALPGARLLPGMGPAPRPAADAVRRDVRLLPHRACRAPSTGSRLRREAPGSASPTNRRPRAPWPTSCCGVSTAARSTPRRFARAAVSATPSCGRSPTADHRWSRRVVTRPAAVFVTVAARPPQPPEAVGSGHGGVGGQPVRQGGEPRRSDRPWDRPSPDPRPQRQ